MATASTAPEYRRQQVFLILPEAARRWAREQGIPQPLVARHDPVSDAGGLLRISAPDPYTVYELSEQLPAEAQRLRLEALAPAGTRSVSFLLNGEVVGSARQAPWRTWWTLESGAFSLVARATLSDGGQLQSQSIEFSVVEAQALPAYERGS